MPQLLYLDTGQVGFFYQDAACSVVFYTVTAEQGVLVPYQNHRLVVSSGFVVEIFCLFVELAFRSRKLNVPKCQDKVYITSPCPGSNKGMLPH